MYQNCIFDLYGTLIDIRTDESGEKFWSEVAAIYKSYGAEYTAKDIEHQYHRLAKRETRFTRFAHPTYQNIEINLENVFRYLYARKGVKATDEIIRDTAIKFRSKVLKKQVKKSIFSQMPSVALLTLKCVSLGLKNISTVFSSVQTRLVANRQRFSLTNFSKNIISKNPSPL